MTRFAPYLHKDEAECVNEALAGLPWDCKKSQATRNRAIELVYKIREAGTKTGELESFMKDYSLTTDEGLALMCLAEALLRIPDSKTQNALIHDKVAAANWLGASGDSKDWVVKAAGVGMFVTQKTMGSVLARVGEPFIRQAMIKAMRVIGRQFVLGRNIEEATLNAESARQKGYRMSYDVLGEGARTAADAEKYFNEYMDAITYIGERGSRSVRRRPGISVKLSALHPRYEYAQKEICIPEMTSIVSELARNAMAQNLTMTIDAEEADRLDLSVQILENVLQDKTLHDWTGLGLAVQAYQKRALPLVDHIFELSKTHKTRLQVRLVKGAYWDSEIKHAQVEGLADYPVFTRKANTDLSFQACAYKLFTHCDYLYPMLATHNAQSVAAILEMAKDHDADFEFQRLHGMGESLYDIIMRNEEVKASIYAPVGSHRELLPYLVRRLLENGANSSFVNKILDHNEPIEHLVEDPVELAKTHDSHRHSHIPLPRNLYGEDRINAQGLDLSDAGSVDPVLRSVQTMKIKVEAAPLIAGKLYKENTVAENSINPAINSEIIGRVYPANKGLVDKAVRVAGEAFDDWDQTPAAARADILNTIADLYETHRSELMALCVREAGKTVPDALAEVREAVDFCRYYAQRGAKDFAKTGQVLPGPTGESNVLTLHGRGVFACISPWNFPLAIFTGQIVAALMAGNSVVAKPAEQTSLIAMRAVQLMHSAGIPKGALNLLPGDGEIGAHIVQHPGIAGVAFTGSNDAAWAINKSLADGALTNKKPIVPFIAETGGQNAMIVDSSALPEQVIDDVLHSAFGSAGQRCSALRILCLQEDTADQIIRMLKGAMAELSVGNPAKLSTDVGPVIDEEAQRRLIAHRRALGGFGKMIAEVDVPRREQECGHYFAPCAFEIPEIKYLEKEVFGPILHVVRYKAEELNELIDAINATGYGLTLGVHSRIESAQDAIIRRSRVGNAYVNRGMTGAVVGVQPFGGRGLSGTGPKAGGPHYLPRFATEKVTSINTTASGGDARLVSLGE